MAVLPADPERVYSQVADLGTYPGWLRIVLAAAPIEGTDPPAWDVEIGARVGPLRRSKRLRMVRTVDDRPFRCRFDRAARVSRTYPSDAEGYVLETEVGASDQSPWVLGATLEPTAAGGTELVMDLSYGGRRWLPGLDLVLDAEIKAAGRRLRDRLA